MHIVIDIPDKDYQVTLTKIMLACYGCKITELPKGHGRLIDADSLEIGLHNKAFDKAGSQKFYEIVWAQKQVHNAPTIIEADKETDE